MSHIYTFVVTTWESAPVPLRYAVYGYLATAFASSFAFSYQAGKEGLLSYRQSKRDLRAKPDYKPGSDYVTVHGVKVSNDYEAVKRGISHRSWENGWKSFMWPFHVAETMTSELILLLNKEDTTTSQ